MPNLLVLQNSANLETSASRRLVDIFVETYVRRHPDAEIVHRDLARNPPPHLSPSLAAALLPGQGAATPDSGLADILTEELEAADIIVIGAPSTISPSPRRSRPGSTTSSASAAPSPMSTAPREACSLPGKR